MQCLTSRCATWALSIPLLLSSPFCAPSALSFRQAGCWLRSLTPGGGSCFPSPTVSSEAVCLLPHPYPLELAWLFLVAPTASCTTAQPVCHGCRHVEHKKLGHSINMRACNMPYHPPLNLGPLPLGHSNPPPRLAPSGIRTRFEPKNEVGCVVRPLPLNHGPHSCNKLLRGNLGV